MLKTIFCLIVCAASSSTIFATEAQFCKGFAQGYLEGWNGQTIQAAMATDGTRNEKPEVPACHIEPLDNDDNSTLSSFEQGERKGLQRGIKGYKDDLGSGSATDMFRRAAALEAAKVSAAEATKQRAIAAKEQVEAAEREKAEQQEGARQHQLALQQWLPGVTATLIKCINNYYAQGTSPGMPPGVKPLSIDRSCENFNNADVIEFACRNAIADIDRAHLGCERLKTYKPKTN
jgi:hypothetical protein